MVNVIYLYENSLENLLNLIFYLIKNKKKPFLIKERSHYEENLLDYFVFPEIFFYENIIDLWKGYVGEKVFRQVYYVFLSSFPNKEIIIYYFLLNALKYKEKVLYMRNLNCVNQVLKIASYVKHENHKLKGFLRFQMTKKHFLYAQINPTNDILPLLAGHFVKRLSSECFVIHDVARDKYVFYDKVKPYFVEGEMIPYLDISFSKDERKIEDLWKSFFKTIAIKERKNLKCQRNFMPKKYWKYILEMEE